MSTSEGRTRSSFADDGAISSVGRGLFGDRIGLTVFLASVALFTVYWIADWRITDSLTLLNGLHALAEGNLHMTESVYGGSLDTPGTTEVDGRVYSRNYGILVVSLLPLALFRFLGAVADLRLAVTGLWILGLLAATLLVGNVIGRRREAVTWGTGAAIALFAVNVVVATDLDPSVAELYALQFTHLVVAGFVVVFCYRLLARIHGRRVGLFAAALLALGTPIGLWATVPKRHVLTALVFVVSGYALYRSREAEVAGTRLEVVYRAAAYASVGMLAWVHAPEALTVLVVLGVVDLPTAPRRDPRALAGIGSAFVLSLIPFFVTNALAFGSPVEPPRLATGGGGVPSAPGSSGGEGGGIGGTSTPIPIVTPLLDALDPALAPLLHLSSLFGESLGQLVDDPGTFWEVFVRSGNLEGNWAAEHAGYEAANLSLVESGPVVAAIVGVVGGGVRTVRHRAGRGFSLPLSPTRTVDAYAGVFAIALVLLYFERLPLHAQVTLRYLFPVFPVIVYGIARLPAVRDVAREHARVFAWTVAAGVLLGGQLVVVALATMEPGRGEAFQFHALLALSTTLPVAVWALVGRSDGWWGRAGAILLGLAVAATTVFLLLLTFEYWPLVDGPGLPFVRTLSEVVEFV